MDGPPRPHLDRITQLIVELTGAPVSLVSLVDDSRQFFVSQAGLPQEVATDRGTPLSHSLCQYVVVSDEPLVITDAREDPELRSHLAVTELGVVAYCGVPIHDPSGHTLGSLCAIDTAPREWSSHVIAILLAFAEAVSAELDTDARYRRLTVDLHRRLLPASLPASDRWEVRSSYRALQEDVGLGGDFYDAVEGADGSLTLVVGDIVGHEVDAAIAMGQLRAATLTLVHHGSPLDEIAVTLDETCLSLPNVFCSAWVAVRVDPAARAATYLSAGAIPPLLVRSDGDACYLTGATSAPIGATCDRRQGSVPLAAGDVVLLCTDGLVEDRRFDIDFGLERVLGGVRANRQANLQEVIDGLVDERITGASREDDIAVLACRIA